MNDRNKILLLFSIGILSRLLIYLVFADRVVIGNDQMQCIMLARRFAAGDVGGSFDAYWTPLYPVLIGIVSLFLDSLVLPSVIISIVAGGLAVPLTYQLVKEFFEEREALIAAALAVFFPHLVNSFFGFGTENIYLLWMNASLLCAWRGLKNRKTKCFFVTGVLLGLAYLTRPEAFAYPFYFAFLTIAVYWREKLFSLRRMLKPTAALLIGFFLFAAPYLVFLRAATGHWTISEKTNNNTVMAELDETGSTELPLEEDPEKTESHAGVVLLHAVEYNLKTIHQTFPSFMPPFLMMLVGLALFREAASRERLRRDVYLILFCLITVIGYAVAAVQIRYFYFLLPVFFGWIAKGILQLETWLRETIEKSFSKYNAAIHTEKFVAIFLLFVFLYTLPLDFFMRPKDQDQQFNAYEERDAGIWIRQHTNLKTPLIFSASSRPVFYAEGRQLSYEAKTPEQILQQIQTEQPDFIVTSERSLKRHPHLLQVDQILRNSPDIECLYDDKENAGYRITIYRLKTRL